MNFRRCSYVAQTQLFSLQVSLFIVGSSLHSIVDDPLVLHYIVRISMRAVLFQTVVSGLGRRVPIG